MIHLNAGNLWDHEYLDTVIKWNEEFKDTVQVKSLFGSVVGLTPTARSFDRLPDRNWDFTTEYILKAAKNGIMIRYTLNQSCVGSIQEFKHYWRVELRQNLIRLHAAGVVEWTITSPLLVQLVRELFPSDIIEVSTIAEVATPEDARRWLALDVDGVNVSTSVNRDFNMLRQIAATGINVSILANEACLWECPWRRDCYNLSSHNSQRSEELFNWYPFRQCTEMRLKDPVEWLKARLVLPQWIHEYQEQLNIKWFKIAYRTHPKEVVLPMLRYYMEQKFSGNLLELWPTISHLGDTLEPRDKDFISVYGLETNNFLKHFIDAGDACARMSCIDCRYCNRIYQLTTGK